MKSVFFISGRTGLTTESLGNALLTQFDTADFKKEFIQFVDSEAKAENAIVKINSRHLQYGERPIVFSSIINPRIRDRFDLDYVCHIDFFASFIPTLEQELGRTASSAVGMSHGMNDEAKYYKRIEAIDFALYNDDGASDRKS